MKKSALLLFSLTILAFAGCSEDDTSSAAPMSVAFSNPSVNISDDETPVVIAFSKPASEDGVIILNVEATNAVYGTDFSTDPEAVDEAVTVPFSAGMNSATLTFQKMTDAVEGEIKNVKFTIASVTVESIIPAATNATTLHFNEEAIVSNTVISQNGGNTVPNQVFIDLSSGVTTEVLRTGWDLGFYSGDDFRVTINGAINKFAVKQLNTNNIDEIQTDDPDVTTGNYDAANMAYVDAPYGNLTGTAIAPISENDAENKVYLVNLGHDISTTPGTGTGVALTGESRGWKKIRILRSGSDYKLQYADLGATTHTEIIIPKTPTHNFTFFSLINGAVVTAEPQKQQWDISITTFTGETFYQSGESAGAYFFPDCAITNTKAGTRAIEVLTSEATYENFSMANISASDFDTVAAADQRAIGSNWRSTYPLQLKTDRFYVIRDVAGNYYKLKFNSMLNAEGERGYITFSYELL